MAGPWQRPSRSERSAEQHHVIKEWVAGVMSLEDCVTGLIHEQFDKMPQKCKPRRYGANNESTEWTVLAGIAIVDPNGTIKDISVACGIKCLPRPDIAGAKGCVLHDSHAEILAIRAFNRFLLDEVDSMLNGRSCSGSNLSEAVSYQSDTVQWRDGSSEQSADNLDHWQPPFKMKDGLKIFMYCSEMPCGDASIELVMSRQKDQKPWPVDASAAREEGLKGMSHFSQLGIVRRKPGRADSRATGSKSCSDKLALRQCTSLLSSLTSAFITPDNAYIDTLILPEVQFNEDACIRSFGPQGRMKAISNKRWANGYHFHPFRISTTNMHFAYSRDPYDRSAPDSSGIKATVEDRSRSSNGTAIQNPFLAEAITNGVLQGRKRDDPKGATKISRASMMNLALQIRDTFHNRAAKSPTTREAVALLVKFKNPAEDPVFMDDQGQLGNNAKAVMELFKGAKTYHEAKRDVALVARRKVKMDVTRVALQNWTPNEVDDFPIDASCQ